MDCNWCAVCSKHFHSDHQASLYCSEECRKADALACCVFHDCNHPDGSTHHDHLMFCHHHRPAIRIPSLPLLNLNPDPSAEQQAYRQHQSHEWAQFLQQQYVAHYHSHAAHTSTLPSMGHGQNKGQSLSSGHTHTLQQQYPAQVSEQRTFLLSRQLPQATCLQRVTLSQEQQQQQQYKFIDQVHQERSSLIAASREDNASLSSALASLSLSKHCAASLIAQCELDDCEQPCIIRRNKALPPPTLSPILIPTVSNPVSFSPTTPTPSSSSTGNKISTLTLASSLISSSNNTGDEDGQDESPSHAWPKMDKFFFPDHCCRTSSCHAPARQGKTDSSNGCGSNHNSKGMKNGDSKTRNKKKAFVSELPPPPPTPTAPRDSNGCITLSASIWGTGWRQVEPLPESFVKTIQKSNLLWAGCEKEHPSHHGRHYHHQRSRRNTVQGQGSNQDRSKGNSKTFNKNASSDASSPPSWTTVYSSRLPRSLQFID